MKKILGTVLAAAMLMAFSVFAVQAASEGSYSTTVTYTVDPTYTVTIPPTITAESDTEHSVSANVTNLSSDKQVLVKVYSWSTNPSDADNKEHIFLTNQVDYIPFEVRVNGTKVTLNEGNNRVLTVASVTEGITANITITRIDDTVYDVGTYTGNIIFNVSLEKRDEGISWDFPENEDDGVLLPPVVS